jgi:prepilin-type N-terminal cleavage/methylation domain-containing protein
MSRPGSGPERTDAGVTLIEVLVALVLLGVLGSLFLSFGIATARVTDDTSGSVDLNEEARIAFTRLARDLRDADAVTKVIPAYSGSGCAANEFTGIAFDEATTSSTVPKKVAYRWDRSAQRLILSEDVPVPQEQPILAAQVSRLCLQLWSSRWSPLPSQPAMGTSWAELEPSAAPTAAASGTEGWWCPVQLGEVDRVRLTMTASLDGHERTYSTDVFLRNVDITAGGPDAC